jgi:hypothetical protein
MLVLKPKISLSRLPPRVKIRFGGYNDQDGDSSPCAQLAGNDLLSGPGWTHQEACLERVRDEQTQNMLIGYFEYLKEKIEKEKVKGDVRSFNYYSCTQDHDKRNSDWKPFQHLEAHYKERGFNPVGVRETIENRTGRRVVCECQFLNDEKEIKRRRLGATFGVDFGEPGQRDLEVA